MIKNNLLVDSEKREFIDSLEFSDEALWMKDFYMSKITKRLNTHSDSCQGLIKLNATQEETLRLHH